jgi:Fic family protein
MFAEFLNKDEFYKKYMQLYAGRFAIGNLEMENPKMMLDTSNTTIEMYNNMNAFMKLIEQNKEVLTPYDIADVAYDVNKDISFFDRGFRRTQVQVRRAQQFFPPPAKEVIPKMYALCNAYSNIWNILPIYEREARFHIELVRIQPFEDGNKRTARIITSYHLCKQNKAPIVINGDENEIYFQFIDNYDVEGFTKFLEAKSKEELEVMLALYRTIVGDSFDEKTDDLEDGDVHIYQMARERQKR